MWSILPLKHVTTFSFLFFFAAFFFLLFILLFLLFIYFEKTLKPQFKH